jgi:amino acid adenylation domain-containing protein
MDINNIVQDYETGLISTFDVLRKLERYQKKPLSEGQKGLWALCEIEPDIYAYNVPICLVCHQSLDMGKFKVAYHHLLKQYPILTAVIKKDESVPKLIYKNEDDFKIECSDISNLSNDNIIDHLKQKTRVPFAMGCDPMIRLSVLSHSNTEHYILIVVHHIVLDGSSSVLLLETLLKAYHELMIGKKLIINENIVSYGDFVDWEKRMLSSEQALVDRDYWSKQLAGVSSLSGMPKKRNCVSTYAHKGEVLSRKVSVSQVSTIEKFVKTNAINNGVFFLAVFKILLYRYTGQVDITIGMPVIGRPQERFDSVIGHFINMLPVRSHFIEGENFLMYVSRLQKTVFDAIDHAAYPFSKLVQNLEPHNRDVGSPVFQISYNYQSFSSTDELQDLKNKIKDSLTFELINGLYQTGEYDLSLDVLPGKEIVLNFKYHPDIYSAEIISGISNHYINLIDEVIKSSKNALDSINIVSSEERQALLNIGSKTDADYPDSMTCYDLFKEQVVKNPAAPAVTYNNTTLSYEQLYKKSEELALYLQLKGIKETDRVGICVDRSLDIMIGLLAIIKSGATYVTLDPYYPPERLSYMINNSECQAILTQRAIAQNLSELQKDNLEIIYLDEDRKTELISNEEKVFPSSDRSIEETIAYIIYTSGSTGNPKGVVVPHRALTNFLISIKNKIDFSEKDSLLAISTFCFDIAGLELFLPIISGAHCHICDTDTAKDATLLKKMIEHIQPTLMQATPVTWNMLFRIGWKNKEKVKILCCGEKITDNLKQQFMDTNSDVWNGYGPSETTIYSTMKHLEADEPVTIGKPMGNTQIYILDKQLEPVPMGIVGELCISGDGVAKGYFKNPKLTAEKFINDPFRPGNIIYKTGDLACWVLNGDIELIGRMDNQVKVRGFRIELGEIEEKLNEYPQIENSVVVVKKKAQTDKLVSYFTEKVSDHDISRQYDNRGVDLRHLRAYLKQTLPDFMIPGEFICIEKFPVTPNGKIDRAKVVEIDRQTKSDRNQDTQLPIEKIIYNIFKEILSHEDLNKNDRFFDIGGDSFSAIAAIEKINKTFDCNLKVTSLFKYPTIESISTHLQNTLFSQDKPNEILKDLSVENQEIDDLPDYYDDSLAIVGISCQFPDAENYHEFWNNLISGKDSNRLLSPEELHGLGVPAELIEHPNYVPQQASISDKDKFDPSFFNISPRDAEFMDPQSRLLLQNAWKAIEDAGYKAEEIPETGVFMSTSNNFYQTLMPNLVSNARGNRIMQNADEYVAWILSQGGSVPTMISNKIGLKGPSFYVNTNCSSALSGLYLAYKSLLSEEVDQVLVGASAIFPANNLGYLHQPGLNFSSDGRCKAFDNSADGMVGGEGVAVVMLKRARDAINDGDNIYALLRGVAINNDGSNKAGFYAPSVQGQSDVIRKVLDKTKIDPETIRYVEAHGTGTKIGDPIEMVALIEAYEHYTKRRQFCGIGSVKTNIGHLDTAAGMAGLIKVALSLYYGEIPKTLNYKKPNVDIDFVNSPFYVAENNYTLDGQRSTPIRAALSSFGIGGTNAHAILEQNSKSLQIQNYSLQHTGSFLVILSAKNKQQLKAYTKSLLDYIPEYRQRRGTLAALAYTLQTGRQPMVCRVAFLIDDFESLEKKLSAYIAHSDLPEMCFSNDLNESSNDLAAFFNTEDELNELIVSWLEQKKLHKIAQLWANGVNIDWATYYNDGKPIRVSLPTYSFAKNRYWLDYVYDTDSSKQRGGMHKINNPVQVRTESQKVAQQLSKASQHPHQPQRIVSESSDPLRHPKKYVEKIIIDKLSVALKMGADEIKYNESFADYGLDSLAGVDLINQLNLALQLNMDVTCLFDYPTVDKLQEYITEHYRDILSIGNQSQESEDTIEGLKQDSKSLTDRDYQKQFSKEPIAIIGMSGRFPQSDNVDEFWQHLKQGDDLVERVTRWDLSPYQTECNDGGFLKDIDKFDPLFFNISGLEATYMEPQQRIFLEESWKALEDAGYASDTIENQRFSIYVGCAAGDYLDLNATGYPAQALWGNMSSVIPARISYYLNLRGPAIAVDTACSSSLVAIHLACQSLRSREVDMALAGGIFLQCSPRLYIGGGGAGMLSPTGRCRSFDDDADGFVPAEGAGTLILKRLDDALADGDNIHAVIRGSGINQDGTTNGITAPSANSQQHLEQQVYDDFGIDCENIQMIEAHGTGTKLGDPIEFRALTQAFRKHTDKEKFCALGSSKSNIGHAQMAAGVIGIIKILLGLKYKKIPPTLHYNRTNSNIDLENSPFYINTDLREWDIEPGSKRCAAISSFGVSGTNAHVVIEEAPVKHRQSLQTQKRLVVLSARTKEQLHQQVARLAHHCRQNPQTDIGDMSYTLLLGRKNFSHRLACIVSDVNELETWLTYWLAGDSRKEWFVFDSQSESGNWTLSTDVQLRQLVTVAQQYVHGENIDLDLFNDGQYWRISLPTYPFEQESYWFEEDSDFLVAKKGIDKKIDDNSPIIIEQVSITGTECDYRTILTGEEFFLRDHVVQGSSILPGSVYLELAHAAYMQIPAYQRTKSDDMIPSLKNLVLLSPLSVSNSPVRTHIRVNVGDTTQFEISSDNTKPDSEPITHSRGEIYLKEKVGFPPIDLESMLSIYQKKDLNTQQIYAEFRELDINYGLAFQGIASVYTTQGAALVELNLPDVIAPTLPHYTIHPVLMDCAMQCTKFLSDSKAGEGQAQLLFAIQEVQVHRPCTSNMWTWIRYSNDTGSKGGMKKIDVDMTDAKGRICLSIRGISTRPVSIQGKPELSAQKYPPISLLPVWDIDSKALGEQWPSSDCKLVIIGGTQQSHEILQRRYPMSQVVNIFAESSVEVIAGNLQTVDSIDHLLWIAPKTEQILPSAQEIVVGQEVGVLEIFRILKALIKLGYNTRSLGWTIITQCVYTLNTEGKADPTYSSISGMLGSLAKEYPNWQIRVADLTEYDESSLSAVLCLQADPLGNTRLYRYGQWFNQALMKMQDPPFTGETRFKQHGVYIIVGGAGGLGTAISEYLIRKYQAKIIWFGRRAKNSDIDAKIRKLSAIGSAPYYIQADATSAQSLNNAHLEIKKHFGSVNGLIQSAMVLAAASLDKMTEQQFREVLSAKVDVSARLVEEFQDEPLDLVLFISTINSYLKAMGQSNYGAACTFKDSYSLCLAHSLSCAVKVINLGYCFNNIEDSDGNTDVNEMVDFIEREDVMASLEKLLAGELKQMTFMKFTPKWSTRGMIISDDLVQVCPNSITSYLDNISEYAENFDYKSNSSPLYRKAVEIQNELMIRI